MEWQTEGAPASDVKDDSSPYDHLIEVFLLYQCRVCQFSSVESKNNVLTHIRTKHCKDDGSLQEAELFSASISVFGENFANTLSSGARPHSSQGKGRASSGRETVNLGHVPGRLITKATVKAVREVIDTSSLKLGKSRRIDSLEDESDGDDGYRYLGNSDDEEVSDLGKEKDPDYRPSGVPKTVYVSDSEDHDHLEGDEHLFPLKKRVKRSKVIRLGDVEKAEDDGIDEKDSEGPGVRTRQGRKRGRKVKVKVKVEEGVKRKRGRPRKVRPAKVQKPKFMCRVDSCSYRPLTQETLELHEKCHIDGADDFKCFLCDHVTNRWSAMNVHINYSHKNMYYCQECEYSTRALPFLKRHMADKHLHSALCEQCGRSFPSSSYLALHVIEEHSDKAKNKCPQCNFTTPYEHELEQHLTCHLPQFLCKVCGEKFSTKMELAGHIQILHPGEKVFFCDFCSYTAKLKHHLENHMNSQHTARGVFPCPDCGKVYKTQHHVDDHRQRQHKRKADKAYPCHYCDFVSTSLQGIHLHEKQRHTAPTPVLQLYNCEHCDKSFPTKSKRTTHMKQTHLRSYKCPHCEFSSGDKAHLRSHLIKHLSKDPDDAVKCPHCKQVFLGKDSVRAHVKESHPGLQVTFCNQCNFSTKHKGSLWKHRDSTHSGKVFMCSHCGKKLKTLDCVRTHERNHCPVVHEGRRNRIVYLPTTSRLREGGNGGTEEQEGTEHPANVSLQTQDSRVEQTDATPATTQDNAGLTTGAGGSIYRQESLVASAGGVPSSGGVTGSENTPLVVTEAQNPEQKGSDGDESLLRQESVVMRTEASVTEASVVRRAEYVVMRQEHVPISETLMLRPDMPPRSVSVPYTRHDMQRTDVPLTMAFMRPENLLSDRRSEFADSQGSSEQTRTFTAYEHHDGGGKSFDSSDARIPNLPPHTTTEGARPLDPITFEREHFAHMYRREFLQQQREIFERGGVNVPMTTVDTAIPVNLAQDRQSLERSTASVPLRGFTRSDSPNRDAPRETPTLASYSPLTRLPWDPLSLQRQHPNVQAPVNRELSREAELLLSFSQTPGDMHMQ